MSNIGQILKNKYKLKEIIGSGGMGVIYLAERMEIGDEVAIKRLNVGHDYNELLKEAKANGILNHPNICKVYDFFEEQSQHYLVLERLEGYDLSEILAFHKNRNIFISQDSAISIIIKCLEALQYSHNLNKPNCQMILHRDIKPANIFLTNQGEIKILDFGIASLVKNNEKSNDQIKAFSENYSCPDLWSNQKYKSHEFAPSNDLYSLGLVFAEMMSNKRVFNSIDEVIKGNVFDISTYLKTTPRFKCFVEKWLDKSNSKRFKDASEILECIREFENPELDANEEVKSIIAGINEYKESAETIKKRPKKEKKKKDNFKISSFFLNLEFPIIAMGLFILCFVSYSYQENNKYQSALKLNNRFSNLKTKNYRTIGSLESNENSSKSCFVIALRDLKIYHTSDENKFYELQKLKETSPTEIECFENVELAVKSGYNKN